MLLSWERCPAGSRSTGSGRPSRRPRRQTSPRAGRLVEVNLREGDAVEPNDVMARVDTTT